MSEKFKDINPVLAHILSQKATPEEQITNKAVEGFVDSEFGKAFAEFQEAHAEGISRKFPDGTPAEAKAAYYKVWAVAGERMAKGRKSK